MMWGYGMGVGYWLLTGIMMVIFWGLIIVGVVLVIRHFGGPHEIGRSQPAGGPGRPEDVLAERFARGDIDADEYRQRLELLRESRR